MKLWEGTVCLRHVPQADRGSCGGGVDRIVGKAYITKKGLDEDPGWRLTLPDPLVITGRLPYGQVMEDAGSRVWLLLFVNNESELFRFIIDKLEEGKMVGLAGNCLLCPPSLIDPRYGQPEDSRGYLWVGVLPDALPCGLGSEVTVKEEAVEEGDESPVHPPPLSENIPSPAEEHQLTLADAARMKKRREVAQWQADPRLQKEEERKLLYYKQIAARKMAKEKKDPSSLPRRPTNVLDAAI
eukprot:Rmarinus@m.13626